jgi:hypothetical protein
MLARVQRRRHDAACMRLASIRVKISRVEPALLRSCTGTTPRQASVEHDGTALVRKRTVNNLSRARRHGPRLSSRARARAVGLSFLLLVCKRSDSSRFGATRQLLFRRPNARSGFFKCSPRSNVSKARITIAT